MKLIYALAMVLTLATLGFGADPLGDAAKASGKPLVVDFGQNLCKQCIKQSEVMEQLKSAAGDKLGTRFVHVAKEAQTAGEYKVMLIPTLIFFNREGKEVFRQVGFMPFDDMMSKLKELGLLPG